MKKGILEGRFVFFSLLTVFAITVHDTKHSRAVLETVLHNSSPSERICIWQWRLLSYQALFFLPQLLTSFSCLCTGCLKSGLDAVSKCVFHFIAGQTEEVKRSSIWVFWVLLLQREGWSFSEFRSNMSERVAWEVGEMYGEGFRSVMLQGKQVRKAL